MLNAFGEQNIQWESCPRYIHQSRSNTKKNPSVNQPQSINYTIRRESQHDYCTYSNNIYKGSLSSILKSYQR